MVTYTSAEQNDIPACARLYRDAFPEALSAIFGRPDISLQAIEDIFTIFHQFESDGFLIAHQNGVIIGYIITVSNIKRLYSNFIWRGYPFRLLFRWVFNRYEKLSLGFIPRLFQLWWEYRKNESSHSNEPMSQILSIVVSPKFQGQGFGTQLIKKALDYLKSLSVTSVRLEVDEKNISAIHVYKKLGFIEQDKLQTPLGPALIMIKFLEKTNI